VVIENRPGAGTVIGADAVARSAPDGHTLLIVPSTHVVNTSFIKKLPFDPIADFTPITIFASLPMAIVAGNQQPFKSMKELVSYAKANPGKLSIGSSDSLTVLAGEMLKSMAKIDMQQITYKGGAPTAQDVMGGHIPLGVLTSISAVPLHKAKSLNVLAVTGPKRTAALADVPTVAEAAGLPDYDIEVWYVLLGPAKMPKEVVDRLQREVSAIVANKNTQARLVGLGIDPVLNVTPEQARATMRKDMARWDKIIKDAGIRPE
jgi:tripartite-type tricarboxylate transporter receptor subunit TctC